MMLTNDVVLTVGWARLVDALLNCLPPTTHLQNVKRLQLVIRLDSENDSVDSCSGIVEFVMLVFIDFHALIILFQRLVEAVEAGRFSQHLPRLFCWKRRGQCQGLLALRLHWLMSSDYNRRRR